MFLISWDIHSNTKYKSQFIQINELKSSLL
jgi:hypothetical protein